MLPMAIKGHNRSQLKNSSTLHPGKQSQPATASPNRHVAAVNHAALSLLHLNIVSLLMKETIRPLTFGGLRRYQHSAYVAVLLNSHQKKLDSKSFDRTAPVRSCLRANLRLTLK